MSHSFAMIYAEVPKIACRGKCQASCGPISAHRREVDHFEASTGKRFPQAAAIIKNTLETGASMECPYLNPLGQCDVYQNRPLICRLWGVAAGMPCMWGCRPERALSDEAAGEMLRRTR